MLDISAQLATFEEDMAPEAMAYIIAGWVEALAKTNLIYLRLHPETTPLYDRDDVFYLLETPGEEDFFDIPTVIDQGHADCEDLAAWRIAELWSIGEWAAPLVSWTAFDNGDIDFHIQVSTRYGTEDPSEAKGMPAVA